MKAKIYLLLAVFLMLLVNGCGKKAEPTETEGATDQNAITASSATTVKQKGTDLYTKRISDVEYAFLLWGFRDQVVSDLTYQLSDNDGDGANELLIDAITDKDNGAHTQFLADSNDTRYHFWGFTATGAAQSSDYCTMKGYNTILWNEDYSTIGYKESHYHQWTGSAWKEIDALNGISFDYKNKVTLKSSNLLNIEIKGDAKSIFAATDAYFKKRSSSHSVGKADLDGDGRSEKIYYIFSAADDWYKSLRMENTTEKQSFQDHRDIYMTVIIADQTAQGVVIRPVRVKYRGAKIKLKDKVLYINNQKYVYKDKKSVYTSPCLQTALKSPGTYGDFDSKGNRTILSMVNMPFYDISIMCTNITLYKKEPKMASAKLGNSRCNFKFMITSDNGLISEASPAYMVQVASWNLVKKGMTIDKVPIIGNFRMGDSIEKLRKIMIPSTKWKPLLCGQDAFAHTSFYYRPSYENEEVYFVQVWTDSEGKNSKVCAIEFEVVYSKLNAATKKALGLK